MNKKSGVSISIYWERSKLEKGEADILKNNAPAKKPFNDRCRGYRENLKEAM